jgi:hypothetical protein
MPAHNKKYIPLVIRYFLWLTLLVSPGLSIAQTNKESSFNIKDDWKFYPFTFQLSGHVGATIPGLLMRETHANKVNRQRLYSLGGRFDISLLYTTEWAWEYLTCFPKLGLLGKYDQIIVPNLNQEAYIAGGIFYIEPSYLHLKRLEIVPRIGVGICQIQIPGSYYAGPEPEPEEEQVHSISPDEVEPFREGMGLNIIADLLFKFKITPRFHLNWGLGVDYMPDLSSDTTSNADTPNPTDRSLTFYNTHLSCSYTINPNDFIPKKELLREPRIDLSYVSAFRKIPAGAPLGKPAPSGATQQPDLDPNTNYYIGGLHAQWTLPIANYHHGFVFGTEWVKDSATKKQLESMSITNDIKASFLLGHEFLWGRVVLGQYAGFYILNMTPHRDGENSNPLNNLFYTQLGGLIRITKWLHVGASIRHAIHIPPAKGGSKATQPPPFTFEKEFIDFKIGYSF